MTFAFPIWLTALLPWAGVVIYLLLGKWPRADVPFINLWRGPVASPRTNPSIQRLPLWIALLMAAAAMAIISASGPRWRSGDQQVTAAPSVGLFGIESVMAAHDQFMVRVLNFGPARQASLVVERNGQSAVQPLDLPMAGEARNYFIPIAPDVTNVNVTLKDAEPDMRGRSVELVRRQSWPMVKALSPLPEALQRMTEVYAARRPASSESPSIAIVTGDAAKLDGGAGVVIADATQPVNGTPEVVTHAVIRGIDWSAELVDARVAAAPAAGWTPLVTVADRMVVGVHEQPARQAWIGFDSPAMARKPEFVVFWTNVFNWVGQGGEAFEPIPGTVFASVQPPIARPIEPVWRDLSPWLACVAVALSAVAMAAFPRRFP